MSATATRPRLPVMPPVEKLTLVKPTRDLPAEFDVLAHALSDALDVIATLSLRIATLEAKIRIPKRHSDLEPFSTIVPATDNAPARRIFDASSFIATIAERNKP